MSADTQQQIPALVPLPGYHKILVAADASDHSNHGVSEAVAIAGIWQGEISGAHVYAAAMHDRRFRQMEGGLPEKYRQEQELERQRDVHDELITRGLSVITDSYLDQAEQICDKAGLSYRRRSLEGKNYTELVNEANSGQYDLLIMGAQGLGSVPGGRLGTVSARTTRRSNIDTLVIKNPECKLSSGPIVVAIDGSSRAYGGLVSALALAQNWQVPVKVIAAYDPYYHYVAFNRIAAVLSEEASKVFRFSEQEKLHEEIIDAGLAKIYQGHLEVASSIATDYDISIETTLLEGKPHEVIQQYVQNADASLLVIGKTGIHADPDLDIGGNAENLLRDVSCAVLLSQREHTPQIDVVAQSNTSWTVEAEARMQSIPSFAQGMARVTILRYAQAQGHTVITDSIVVEATKNLCPAGHMVSGDASKTSGGAAENAGEVQVQPDWSTEATAIAEQISDSALRSNLKSRAEKKARQEGAEEVQPAHISSFLQADEEITNTVKCPLGFSPPVNGETVESMPWDEAALARLNQVPHGFMRKLTQQRIETFAREQGHELVTTDVMKDKFSLWAEGSAKQQRKMRWDARSLAKIQRIPEFIRGMVIKEVERAAQELGSEQVDSEVYRQANTRWAKQEAFHYAESKEQTS